MHKWISLAESAHTYAASLPTGLTMFWMADGPGFVNAWQAVAEVKYLGFLVELVVGGAVTASALQCPPFTLVTQCPATPRSRSAITAEFFATMTSTSPGCMGLTAVADATGLLMVPIGSVVAAKWRVGR